MDLKDNDRPGPAAIETLRKWQKRMTVVFAITMAYLIVLLGCDLFLGLSERVARIAFAGLVLLAGLGVLLQFSQKCPGCGYRIGFQSRLLTPEACKRCGIPLK